MDIHIDSTLVGRVQGHLRRRKTEQVAFLFATATGPQILTASDIYLVPSTELVHESRFHAEISEEAQAKIIKMAADKSLLLVEIHSHPGSVRDTGFSPSDLAGFRDFVPHIFWRLRAKEYAALVFGDHDYDALAWVDDPVVPVRFGALVVDGRAIIPTGVTIRELERQKREAERYSRQIAMFGKEGQERISQVSVVIVGVGGIGSHIVQQLAYAGVKKYFLVDMDRLDRSNLNRFVIGTENDLGRLKAEVARDFIRRVQADADISIIPESVISGAAFDAVSKGSVAFGCVDNDGPRLVLLELCCSMQKPYIDVATDVPSPGCFGGRMVFTGVGKGCLACREELDQSEVRRFFATPEQRIEDDKIYGIDRSAFGTNGPSVVFLNGTLASLAVTEFVTFITGLRAPLPYLTYRGEMGIVTTTKASGGGCYYCDSVWSGDSVANPGRYLNLKG
jgi:molybdopterin/thiamine biosynthesis adenylyltransferase